MSHGILMDRQGSVAILPMNTPENRHNPQVLVDFHKALDEIEKDESIFSVVLTSASEKNWCLGLDLDWFSAGQSIDDVEHLISEASRLFRRLVSFNVPVIAALNGHAFGNGAILACACDIRMMRSDRGYFCFPEVDLSIPFLPSMLAIVQKAIPLQYFNYLMLTGQRGGCKRISPREDSVRTFR